MPHAIAEPLAKNPVFLPIEGGRALIALSLEWPGKVERPAHFHDRCQLVFASKGIMDVITDAGTWVVPPQRAVWVPASMPHSIQTKTNVSLRTIYIEPDAAHSLPRRCCVISVAPFLRELLLQAMDIPALYSPGGRDERLVNLIFDELSGVTAEAGELHLPEPKDSRVGKIVEALKKDPSDPRTREDWARVVGASSRTIHRIFITETGMSFGAWKKQAILLEALRRLADGKSVTTVALDLGYSSPSAFIYMFRQALGVTPSRFFSPIGSESDD